MTPTVKVAATPYPFPAEGPLVAAQTALLVIDMQHDFCAPDGYIARLGYDVAPLRRPIAPLVRALAAARRAGLAVLYTRQGYRADLADLAAAKRARYGRAGVTVGEGGVLVRGTAGWPIIPELAPVPGEAIIDKTANSAFYGTDLEPVLRAKGVSDLVFTGNTIDVCVHSTLRQAVDRGYRCLVLADCCGAVSEDLHRAAVAMVTVENGVFGAVADGAALCAALEALGPGV